MLLYWSVCTECCSNCIDRLRVGWLTLGGHHESRRCSRDTYPESYITKNTSIRRLTSRVLLSSSGSIDLGSTLHTFRATLRTHVPVQQHLHVFNEEHRLTVTVGGSLWRWCRRHPQASPPWWHPRGKWMVSLVNSHTNATSKRWHRRGGICWRLT